MKIGQPIPHISLYNQDNELVNVSEFKKGHNLVIYFYPKNESKVCTSESCSFRDAYSDFLSHNCHVIGINNSEPYELKHFKENHRLPFMLLSDPGYKIHSLFGVKHFWILSDRETFLFDSGDILMYRFNNLFNGEKHVSTIINQLK